MLLLSIMRKGTLYLKGWEALTVNADDFDHGENEKRKRCHFHFHHYGCDQKHHEDDGETARDSQFLRDPTVGRKGGEKQDEKINIPEILCLGSKRAFEGSLPTPFKIKTNMPSELRTI